MKRKIIKAVIKLYLKIFFRVKIVGQENVPKNKPAIICPNHLSYYDPAIIVAFNKRHVNMIGKKELMKNVFTRFLCKNFNVFLVDRNGRDIEAVKHSLNVLKKGELLGIFPEGTRNGLAKGVEPKNGAVQMAIKTGTPIIPVGIKGNYKLFKQVVVTYGKPIYYNKDDLNTQDKELITKLTSRLMESIVDLTK